MGVIKQILGTIVSAVTGSLANPITHIQKFKNGIVNVFKGIFRGLGAELTIRALIDVINGISDIISDLLLYKTVYKIVGIFATRKFKPAKNQHKYAILVAARNEEAVIGQLIEDMEGAQVLEIPSLDAGRARVVEDIVLRRDCGGGALVEIYRGQRRAFVEGGVAEGGNATHDL